MIETLAGAAVFVAWVVFRFERLSRQQAAVREARSRLRAVEKAMLQGPSGQPGWGEIYFAKNYAEGGAAQERAQGTSSIIEKGGIDEVFVVPPEPLELLATATGVGEGLITERTVAAANFALWRIHVFNQLVGQLSRFNSRHIAELLDEDLPPARRRLLARSGRALSLMLHDSGIGEASADQGWYGELKAALAENIDQLSDADRFRWPGEAHLAGGDLVAVGLLIAAIVTAT